MNPVTDYAIFCASGKYRGFLFYRFYSLNHKDLVLYKNEQHNHFLKECEENMQNNKFTFVKVEVGEDSDGIVIETLTSKEIKTLLIKTDYDFLMKNYDEYFDRHYKRHEEVKNVKWEMEKLQDKLDNLTADFQSKYVEEKDSDDEDYDDDDEEEGF